MNPVLIPSIPTTANPTLWRQVEARLAELNRKEKTLWENGRIEQRDRTANKILLWANDHLRRNEWDRLWQLLAERGAIAVVAPPPEKPKPNPKPKQIETRRDRVATAPQEFKNSLHLILSDRWNTVPELAKKFAAIYPEVNARYIDIWLLASFRLGLCYAYKEKGDKLAYYANCDASEFEDCWLPLCQALKIAKENGYNLSVDYFSAWRKFGNRTLEESQAFYAHFGLDYRVNIPEGELSICRWRRI